MEGWLEGWMDGGGAGMKLMGRGEGCSSDAGVDTRCLFSELAQSCALDVSSQVWIFTSYITLKAFGRGAL